MITFNLHCHFDTLTSIDCDRRIDIIDDRWGAIVSRSRKDTNHLEKSGFSCMSIYSNWSEWRSNVCWRTGSSRCLHSWVAYVGHIVLLIYSNRLALLVTLDMMLYEYTVLHICRVLYFLLYFACNWSAAFSDLCCNVAIDVNNCSLVYWQYRLISI